MDKQALIKKLGGFSLGPIVGAALGLISTPLFTYFLSPEEFGKATMFLVATTIIQIILFLGMDQAYAKFYYQTKDHLKLLVNAMMPSFFLVIMIEFILFFLRERVSYWLFASTSEILCIYALMLMLPALAIERFALLNIRMEQRSILYSVMMIVLKLLTMILTVFFLLFLEKSFRSIVFGQSLAQIFFAVTLILVQQCTLTFRFSCVDKVDKSEIIRLLKFGTPLLISTIIGWLLNGTDKVMMRIFCGYRDIGLYAVALKISAVLALVQSSFTLFWVPVAHQWYNEKVADSRFTKVGRILSCFMAFVFLTILLSRDIVLLLFKPAYSQASLIVPFLLFTPIMHTVSEVTVMGIYFKEKTVWTLFVSFTTAVSNILLNLLLIPIFGAIGASIATGISYICFFWGRTLLSRKLWYPFPLSNYIFITFELLIASLVCTFYDGWLPYVVTVTLLLAHLFYFKNEVNEIFNLCANFAKK